MKKICFFYTDITGTGGIEKMISIIGNELVKNKDYEINILSVREKNKVPFFFFDDRIRRETLKNNEKGGGILDTILLLRKYVKSKKIDILVVCNVASDIIAIPATRFTETRLISWEHFGFSDNISNKWIKQARGLATKFSDYIIVLTKNDEEEYRKKFNISKKVKIVQIYNPIENEDYNETIKNNKNILTIGHFAYVKGYDLLLEVAKNVLKKHEDWKWTIIGDGILKEEIIKKVKEYNLEKQIIIKSKIKDVSSYYKNSEIYVNTSRSEGFPVTVLEAKSYNLPIIAFRLPGITEMVENGENAILIDKYNIQDMQDKICDLIENNEKREIFSQNAKVDKKKFSKNEIINQWKDIINNI